MRDPVRPEPGGGDIGNISCQLVPAQQRTCSTFENSDVNERPPKRCRPCLAETSASGRSILLIEGLELRRDLLQRLLDLLLLFMGEGVAIDD